MNDDQVRGFVVRYRGLWRGGPSNDELARLFASLDERKLEAALDRLARDTDYPPTVAEIVRAHDRDFSERTYGWARPEDTGEVISPAQAYACNPELAAWRERRAHLRR